QGRHVDADRQVRLLPSDLGQLPAVELPARHLDRGVGAALSCSAIVAFSPGPHDRIQCRVQDRSTFGIEPAVDSIDAVERLAQVQEAAAVGLVGVAEDTVGVEAVLEVPDRPLQSPGTDLLGYLDQDGLRLSLELVAELACGLRDQGHVPVADSAGAQSLLRLR